MNRKEINRLRVLAGLPVQLNESQIMSEAVVRPDDIWVTEISPNEYKIVALGGHLSGLYVGDVMNVDELADNAEELCAVVKYAEGEDNDFVDEADEINEISKGTAQQYKSAAKHDLDKTARRIDYIDAKYGNVGRGKTSAMSSKDAEKLQSEWSRLNKRATGLRNADKRTTGGDL